MLEEARELGLAATKLVGLLLSSVYLAYGLAALPMHLIKDTDQLSLEESNVDGNLQIVRSELRRL